MVAWMWKLFGWVYAEMVVANEQEFIVMTCWYRGEGSGLSLTFNDHYDRYSAQGYRLVRREGW